jgi:DNA-binding transcriptional ArsR family regulator
MTATPSATGVFHAVADPNRRRLLDLLMLKARGVQDLAGHFDISLAAVSQHLKVLLDAGLVSRQVRGRFRIYRVEPQALREVHDWTEQYRAFWEGRLVLLGDYLDRNNQPDDGP